MGVDTRRDLGNYHGGGGPELYVPYSVSVPSETQVTFTFHDTNASEAANSITWIYILNSSQFHNATSPLCNVCSITEGLEVRNNTSAALFVPKADTYYFVLIAYFPSGSTIPTLVVDGQSRQYFAYTDITSIILVAVAAIIGVALVRRDRRGEPVRLPQPKS